MSAGVYADLSLAKSAVADAAELLRRRFRDDAGVEKAPGRDIKTRADVAAEECIRNHLAKSCIAVLAEESATNDEPMAAGIRWIVDPLDGTMNFVRGLPLCAISVGLWDGTAPLLGVIRDLYTGRTYSGAVGVGAWCNEAPIRVSDTAGEAQSVLATGFPTNRDYSLDGLSRFITQIQGFKKIRMLGSAALSLAYVAAGHLDAYVEENIMMWDVAAGLAIVKAAGGDIAVRSSTVPHAWMAAATNGRFPAVNLITA
jgi:myo-inositol-1(or 4)-monophosphatase